MLLMFGGVRDMLKYLAKSKEIMQNWARPPNFDILFCVSFEHQYQKLISS